MIKLIHKSNHASHFEALKRCVPTGSDNACVRATNYPFIKLMEIAESVPAGTVRQTPARVVFKRQDFKFL